MSVAITVEEAQASFKELILKLAPGEEVVITQSQLPVAKFSRSATETAPPCPWAWEGQHPVYGS